jgi:hypothetical protein
VGSVCAYQRIFLVLLILLVVVVVMLMMMVVAVRLMVVMAVVAAPGSLPGRCLTMPYYTWEGRASNLLTYSCV